MDFMIRQFKNDIVNAINNVQFPLEVKRLVVKEVYEELRVVTEDAILQEQQEEQQKRHLEDIIEFEPQEKEVKKDEPIT